MFGPDQARIWCYWAAAASGAGLRVLFIAMVARRILPTEFGAFGVGVAWFFIGSSLAIGLGNESAGLSSNALRSGRLARPLRLATYAGAGASAALALLAIAGTWPHALSLTLVVGAVALVQVPLEVLRGRLRGTERWGLLGASILAEGVLRILILLQMPGLESATESFLPWVAAQLIVTAALIVVISGHTDSATLTSSPVQVDWARVAGYAGVALVVTVAQYVDVVLVPVKYPGDVPAYFAMSTLAKVTWLGALPLAALVVPRVTLTLVQGRGLPRDLLTWSGVFLSFSALLLVGSLTVGEGVLEAIFGASYAHLHSLLPTMVLGSAALAFGAVLGQSLSVFRNLWGLLILALAALAQAGAFISSAYVGQAVVRCAGVAVTCTLALCVLLWQSILNNRSREIS